MPRIYDEDRNPIDFCRFCFPTEYNAEIEYGENCEYEAEHPDYSFDDYVCEVCLSSLTVFDNQLLATVLY